jgi:hypothetical protein
MMSRVIVSLMLFAVPRAAAPTSQPAAIEGKIVTFDVSSAPDLERWARTTLLPTCEEWYPKIVAMLPSDGFTPPAHVTVRFRDGMTVPASTSGAEISCNADWFRRNIKGEAAGAVVHELVHVVQHYGHRGRARVNPGWLVEGIADYIRWFRYEPQTHGATIRDASKAKYDGSYRVTANFLDWVVRTHDAGIIPALNASLRDGTYDDGIWKRRTGKSAAELGAEWKRTLVAAATTRATTQATTHEFHATPRKERSLMHAPAKTPVPLPASAECLKRVGPVLTRQHVPYETSLVFKRGASR